MRLKSLWIGGLLTALLGAAYGLTQTPEIQKSLGGGRGGFGRMDPNERFNQYSGNKEVWSRNDIQDPEQLQRFERTAQMMGITNGVITRQQYVDYMQQLTERFSGMRPGGGPPGTASFQGTPGMTPFPAPTAGPSAQSFDGRSRSGGGNSESRTNSAFRYYDKNGDGLLSNDEIPERLEQLRNERARFDTNGDGFIDATEYRSFSEARNQQQMTERSTNPPSGFPNSGNSSRSKGGPPSPAESPWASAMMNSGNASFDPSAFLTPGRSSRESPSSSPRQPEPPSRPVVYRPGNLPAGLPAWFQQRDTDSDGQIGLYEWLTTGQPLDEFRRMDANGDGFVTVEEVLRDQKGFNGTAVASNAGSSRSGTGSPGFRTGSTGDRTTTAPTEVRISGTENLPADRERALEMMSRWRENMSKGGGGPPGWGGSRSREGTDATSKDAAAPSGERSYSKGRNGNGNGNGSTESKDGDGRRGRRSGGG